MKNLLTVIAITLVTLFSVQNITAQKLSQNQDKPEVIAKTEVAKLTAELGLTGDQSRTIYRAFVAKEVNYKKHINGNDLNNAKVASLKEEFDVTLKDAMKENLTAKQYNLWLSMQEQ